MFTRVARWLVIVALIATTGAHWVLLQSVAWTSMLLANLNERPVVEAVTRTFDGKHPCRLCRAIDSGKKSEKKSACVVVLKRFEMINPAGDFTFSASSQFTLLPRWDETYSSHHSSPPVPPPRAA